MSTADFVDRDERTVTVENASYRWTYFLLTYALLLDVMYRSWVRGEAAWDLMALVVVAGFVGTAYQARQKVLAHRWVMKAVLAACVAGLVAAVAATAF